VDPRDYRKSSSRRAGGENPADSDAGPTFALAATAGLAIDGALSQIPGIGPKRAEVLAERGLLTVGDLLLNLPSRYLDWRGIKPIKEVAPGEVATIAGRLTGLSERPMRGSRWRRLLKGSLQDAGGARIGVVWFNAPPHLRQRFGAAAEAIIQGKVTAGADRQLEIVHPEVYLPGQDPPLALQPSYRAGELVGQRLIRSAIDLALAAADELPAAMPTELRVRLKLPSMAEAVRYLHQPPADADLNALRSGTTAAHRALAADELFAFELALEIDRMRARERCGITFAGNSATADRFIAELPFKLTSAQRRAIDEVRTDMAQAAQMNRLLMGDVGSGKTVVALWALINAVAHGYQAAMMAPTELLAEQHHATFERLCSPSGVKAGLLRGNLPAPRRRQVLQWLRGGEPGIVFGTQALIQRAVEIPRLGLAVIDEQHRFGVFDRVRLQALGPRADMLLLSATPIPRSLARVLLSNLEVTTLEERPAGRPPVTTRLAGEGELDAIWGLVREEGARGNRTYCIVPLIESDDQQELAVTTAADELRRGALAGLRVGSMHGRMSAEEKDSVMREFRDGKLQVLVSTTVVEVGIDVPDATVMVIMGAQRYGLAQLHQLRGRIGRGSQPGHCYLVLNATAGAAARNRLKVLVEKTSGAEIAQADLELRGPGDLFGARQAGPLPLRFAHWLKDLDTIFQLRDLAREWLRRDPDLKTADARGARAALAHLLDAGSRSAFFAA
jgi:ATP-dependent DNA helicase RecG